MMVLYEVVRRGRRGQGLGQYPCHEEAYEAVKRLRDDDIAGNTYRAFMYGIRAINMVTGDTINLEVII